MIPQFAASDYLHAFLGCLPRGRAWPRWLSSELATVCGGLAPSYARNNASAAALVADALPSTTIELLPEWEESLGLPDLCETDPQTLQQRQAAVTARFVAAGGQSIPYYVSVATALGYAVTVTEFGAFRAGLSGAGTGCGDAFIHAWCVNAPTFTVNYFRAGSSMSGEPLQTYGNTSLQCTLRRLSPAHSTVFFSYS